MMGDNIPSLPTLQVIESSDDPQLLIRFIENQLKKDEGISFTNFSLILKHGRRLSGLSLNELARHLTVSPTLFAAWEESCDDAWQNIPQGVFAYVRIILKLLREKVNETHRQ